MTTAVAQILGKSQLHGCQDWQVFLAVPSESVIAEVGPQSHGRLARLR